MMDRSDVDAWMFLAVAVSRGSDGEATLEDMVAAADWINHAIPSNQELEVGLNRLLAARFLSNTRDAFGLTPAGESLYSRVRKRAGIWTQLKRLGKAFEAIETPDDPLWAPAAGVIELAIAAYETKAAAVVAGMTAARRPRASRQR